MPLSCAMITAIILPLRARHLAHTSLSRDNLKPLRIVNPPGDGAALCSEYPKFLDKQLHHTHLALRFKWSSLNSADTCQINREEQTLPLHARPGGSGEGVPAPCQPQAAPPARGILPLRVFSKVRLVLEEGYSDLPPRFGYQRTILLIRTRYVS